MNEQDNVFRLKELAVKLTGNKFEDIQGETIADVLNYIQLHYTGGGGVSIVDGEINLTGDDMVDNGVIKLSDGSIVELPATHITQLTLTSTKGSQAGYTVITVAEVKGEGNNYKYKLGNVLPAKHQDLSNWTNWNGTDEIQGDSGAWLLVAECDASNKAVKCGKVEIVSSMF